MNTKIQPLSLHLVALASFALIGCATPLPVVQQGATQNPNSAYVAALFSGNGQGFGLGFTNISSGDRYLMPFFTYGSYFDAMTIFFLREHEEAVRVVEVPPGKYRITHWAAYDPSSKEQFFEKKIEISESTSTFEAKAGRTVFIGRYKAFQGGDEYKKIHFKITPLQGSATYFRDSLKVAYPSFDYAAVDFWSPASFGMSGTEK